MMTERSNDGRHLNAQAKEALRIRAVEQIEQGQSPALVAAAIGVNIRSVYRWLRRFREGGYDALRNRSRSGRPPKFTEADLQWLAEVLRHHSPQAYGFPCALWTRDLVRELLRRERQLKVSPATTRRRLHRLGFSPQRPLRRAWQQSDAAVEQWKSQTYPAIAHRAEQENARLYCVDESGLSSTHHAGTTWAPEGVTPVVKATGARFSINMMSAVSPLGRLRFEIVEGTVTSDTFAGFIKHLAAAKAAHEKIFLIVDGHPTHRAKRVRRAIESHKGEVELFFLPGYSPELNPDEQVWGYVKDQIGRGAIETKGDLRSWAKSLLHSLQKLPHTVAAFFQHPDCQYATG